MTFGSVALAFPVSGVAVFAFGVDRQVAAGALSVVYSVGLALGLSTAFWPLPALRSWRAEQRVESFVVTFLAMSYLTHLTWELGWLAMHRAIAASPNAAWAYPWWAYIDGGDARYARCEPLLLAMESLSVTNGLVGSVALASWLRSGRKSRAAALAMTGTAVVHLYSASLYFLSELFAGLPSVDTTSFVAVWFKFVLANLTWVVAPFFVFVWARERLASVERVDERAR